MVYCGIASCSIVWYIVVYQSIFGLVWYIAEVKEVFLRPRVISRACRVTCRHVSACWREKLCRLLRYCLNVTSVGLRKFELCILTYWEFWPEVSMKKVCNTESRP